MWVHGWKSSASFPPRVVRGGKLRDNGSLLTSARVRVDRLAWSSKRSEERTSFLPSGERIRILYSLVYKSK